jgi:hypothetical protein
MGGQHLTIACMLSTNGTSVASRALIDSRANGFIFVNTHKPVAGTVFVAITINKNLWGYGFSKFITAWTIKTGYIQPIMINMSLVTLWCFCGVIFWFHRKTFRKWTRDSNVHTCLYTRIPATFINLTLLNNGNTSSCRCLNVLHQGYRRCNVPFFMG